MSERIIPILTGADSRLTTTVPMLSGNYVWHGFDNNSATQFHSTNNSITGDIIWLGSVAYIPTSLQFIQQTGGGMEWRLPRGIILYGSNNDGGSWTQLYSANTQYDQTERAITCENSYTGFKVSISSISNADTYLTFSEMILKGTAGGSVSVHVDTKRQLKTAALANVDTRRKMSGPVSVSIDTSRKTKKAQTANTDTLRRTKTIASANIDTVRRLKLLSSVTVDTSRRRSIPFGYQQQGTRNIVVTIDTERRLS